MICSKIYKICTNVEMCEMCRPDTYALNRPGKKFFDVRDGSASETSLISTSSVDKFLAPYGCACKRGWLRGILYEIRLSWSE